MSFYDVHMIKQHEKRIAELEDQIKKFDEDFEQIKKEMTELKERCYTPGTSPQGGVQDCWNRPVAQGTTTPDDEGCFENYMAGEFADGVDWVEQNTLCGRSYCQFVPFCAERHVRKREGELFWSSVFVLNRCNRHSRQILFLDQRTKWGESETTPPKSGSLLDSFQWRMKNDTNRKNRKYIRIIGCIIVSLMVPMLMGQSGCGVSTPPLLIVRGQISQPGGEGVPDGFFTVWAEDITTGSWRAIRAFRAVPWSTIAWYWIPYR